jgi:hypothetical protein
MILAPPLLGVASEYSGLGAWIFGITVFYVLWLWLFYWLGSEGHLDAIFPNVGYSGSYGMFMGLILSWIFIGMMCLALS